MEEYLVDPHILFLLLPKLLLVRQDAPSDFTSRLLHIHTIGSTCTWLHRTRTFRLRFLRVLVHKSVEEVRKRVEVEICARGNWLRCEELASMEGNRRVIVIEEG